MSTQLYGINLIQAQKRVFAKVSSETQRPQETLFCSLFLFFKKKVTLSLAMQR